MSDKDPNLEEYSSDELDDIMQNVASQLTDDIYDVSSSFRSMDEDLDTIADKLANESDLDQGNGYNFDDDDDAGIEIDLLGGSGNHSFPDESGGLSYEEPDAIPNSSFADSLKVAQAAQASSTGKRPEPAATAEEDNLFDDEDPILLLDEEITMDKESNSGGILAIAALALAVTGTLAAGFATWLSMDIQGQLTELIAQSSNPVKPEPDKKLQELENNLTEAAKKLTATQDQLHANEAALKDHGDRLELILAESKKEEERDTRLATIEKQLSDLNGKLSNAESSIGQTRSQLEKQQEQLRSEVNDSINRLATSPPPRQVTASTDPAAVKHPEPVAAVQPAPQAGQTPAPEPEKMTARVITPKTHSMETPAGAWVVNLASYATERDAVRILKTLQKKGIFPRKRRVNTKGKTWYRLYVDGFANMAAAQRYVKKVQQMPELRQAWAGRAD